MFERDVLGRRIKKAREARGLTLKAVEGKAGISATHVSEIERGKTSPTLGALLRIATALGKAPAYFLEDDELGEVSRVAAEDRVRESLPGGAGTVDRLTTSIAGGRLQARFVVLGPGGRTRAEPHAHAGTEAALVVSGEVEVSLDGDVVRLGPGDAVHFEAALAHTFSNASPEAQARLVWVSTGRDAD
jgi:transcriptional regulator with XRE-family HTH domain